MDRGSLRRQAVVMPSGNNVPFRTRRGERRARQIYGHRTRRVDAASARKEWLVFPLVYDNGRR